MRPRRRDQLIIDVRARGERLLRVVDSDYRRALRRLNQAMRDLFQ